MTYTASLARRAALAVAALALLPASAAAEPKLDGEFPVTKQPRYLTAGPDGNVWVALQDRVAKVAPDGAVTEYDPLPAQADGKGRGGQRRLRSAAVPREVVT
jgi:ABC-type sugar transport system substrate-binding protein